MSAIPTDDRGLVTACPDCRQKNRIPFSKVAEDGRCAACGRELEKLSRPVEIRSLVAFEALVRSSPVPVLVDFWAAWCGPCVMVAPELEKVAAAHTGGLVVAKVNTDEVPELAGRFQIRSIPTLALFVAGREVARDLGAKPQAGIEAFLRQSLAE